MANPELGAKQICPNCQAKFYDLTRRPAHCPKCATEFDPDEAVRSRRSRSRVAPTDLGVLRADVETSLRNVDQLINEVNRKWPFARNTELKLP
ncbi:MAG: TIGR02300 family protein [Rhizobacter sp.]|nr:TIGR02300 family protein [Rhizobacter sp.]